MWQSDKNILSVYVYNLNVRKFYQKLQRISVGDPSKMEQKYYTVISSVVIFAISAKDVTQKSIFSLTEEILFHT